MATCKEALDRQNSRPRFRLITNMAGFIGSRPVAILLIAGALASCGGGGGDDGEVAPPPDGSTPPAVSISSPASGTTVSGSIDIVADATISAGIAGIQFQVDGADTGAEDTVAPYLIPWDTASTDDGPHTLTAVARDMAGNLLTSAPVTVTVANTTEPPDPPVSERVEQTNAAVTLSAGWTQATPEWYAWSGGTAVQSSLTSATATYTFTGTSVAWIGHRSGASGKAYVRVDNGAPVLVNLFARTVEINTVVWSVSGLSPGRHTLTIAPAGLRDDESQGTSIVVDAFVAPAPLISRLQETDPDVVFTGAWTKADDRYSWSGGGVATVPAPPVGGARVSETNGAKATLIFRGTGISWIGYRGRDSGRARVSVDGGTPVVVDTYNPTDKIQATIFTQSGLTDATHTLTIEVLGTRNAASTGTKVVVDALEVTTPGRRYQEEDPAVVYSSGNWIFRNLNRTWSEGTISETATPNAKVTFTFTGTSISWIGCRKLSTGSANVFIDGTLVRQVDTWLPAPAEAYQTTIFRMDGLSPGTHTLEIVHTTTNGAYTVIDAFDVRP